MMSHLFFLVFATLITLAPLQASAQSIDQMWLDLWNNLQKVPLSQSVARVIGGLNVDLKDAGDHYTIEISGQDLDMESLNVSVDNGVLQVSYTQIQKSDPQKNPNIFFSYQSSSSQTVALPQDADLTTLTAEKIKDKMVITLRKRGHAPTTNKNNTNPNLPVEKL